MMSVDYEVVLAVGLEFKGVSEVVDFLQSQGALSEEDLQYIAEYGDGAIVTLCGDGDLPECECLNCFSGVGYYLGFSLDTSDVDMLKASTDRAIRKWRGLFDGVAPDVISAVRSY